MRIRLEKLLLDKENPRFIIPKDDTATEQDIYQYMIDSEALDDLIQGMTRSGFFQIGERVVVMQKNDTDEYIVLEGNRRVCALKALHGEFTEQYDFDQEYKTASEEIDVDVAISRESIQSYLAARHIQGIKLWKAEARRNFYYNHYIDGKSLSDIRELAQQPLGEIKRFIREILFLNLFKEYSAHNDISSPSLIYERIYKYSVKLKLLQDIVVTDLHENLNIVINTLILSEDELKEFYAGIANGIFDDGDIDSRTINKFEDFKLLLGSDIIEEKQPRLKALYLSVITKLNRENFVPIQQVYSAIRDKVPAVNTIIDYSIIVDDAEVKIFFNENEIQEEDFINGIPGKYIIKINENLFQFIILDYIKPSIKVIEKPLKKLQIGVTHDLSSLINIYDIYNEKISIDDINVTITSQDVSVIVNTNKTILINQANTYAINIKYICNGDTRFAINEDIIIKGVLLNGNRQLEEYNGYFNFKFVNVSSVISSLITGRLMDELDITYDEENYYVFASALRSVMELLSHDFNQDAVARQPTSTWALNARNIRTLREECSKLTDNDFKKIAQKYYRVRGILRAGNYLELKNYLGTNIAIIPPVNPGDPNITTLDQVENALHLGAHKSLRNLNINNLTQIQPYLVAWIELIVILIEIDFIY